MSSQVGATTAAAAACAEVAPGSVEASLGWALGTVVRAYARQAATALGDLPGGPRGYHVLSASASAEPCTQQALGRRVGVDRSVMTYLVDDLVTAGLVERRPDPVDRRARQVVITAAGRERLALLEARLTDVDDHVLRELSAHQRETFRALLRQVALSSAAPDVAACDDELADATPAG